ncbi:MAG: metal ABC transporter substrate-binding protein [Thermodesulfobacteriota bacterium]
MFRKRLWITALFFIAYGCFPPLSFCNAASSQKHILVTTFPIYQIVRNITQGCEGIHTDLLLSSHLGCPHDYVVTPQDLQKLAKADILVINGLGMETFLEASLKKANPTITIIDSSKGISDLLPYDSGSGKSKSRQPTPHPDARNIDISRSHNHAHSHDHASETNPHLFASPRMSARIAATIASVLSQLHPELSDRYHQNAETYMATLNRLADDMAALGKRLRNNRIVQPHGIFDYLARDMGLEIVATMQPEGQSPSASEMIRLVQIIREKRVGAIVTEPQYPDKIGKTLSKETGVPLLHIDPAASGPQDAPLDYYETLMRKNLDALQTTIGVSTSKR